MRERPRVLVFSAHAADFCSRAGGTIAKYARVGSPVRIVSLSYGEKGECDLWRANPELDPDRDMEQVKALRQEEATAAAKLLGAEIRFMDWGDYPLLIGREQLLSLVTEIRAMRPDIILSHWTSDLLNQDHQETTASVLRACSCASVTGLKLSHPPIGRPAIFFFESGVPQTEFNGFNPDTYVDITSTFEEKMSALRVFHRTQGQLVDWYTRYAVQRGHQARVYSGDQSIQYAEAFRRFTPWAGEYFP